MQINYTARSFEEIKADLMTLASTQLPEWTNRTDSDLGMIITNLFCYAFDILNMYIDRSVNESYLSTAQMRKSAIHILELINYILAPSTASSGVIFFGLNPSATPVSVAKDFKLSTTATTTQNAIPFLLGSAYTLPVGNKGYSLCDAIVDGEPKIIQLSEGEIPDQYIAGDEIYMYNPSLKIGGKLIIDSVDNLQGWITCTEDINTSWMSNGATMISKYWIPIVQGEAFTDILGASSGLTGQSFVIPNYPYVKDTFIITTKNPVTTEETTWTYFSSLFNAGATDYAYTYTLDENDQATIKFGDGINGVVPNEGDIITAYYHTGKGATGNVPAGNINVISDSLSNATFVINPIGTSGGADREELDHARSYAPLSVATNDRCVTIDDYNYFAGNFRGLNGAIAQAKAISADWKTVNVYVVTEDSEGQGAVASDALKAEVLAFLDTKSMVGVINIVLDPTFSDMYVGAEIKVLPNYDTATILNNVRTALLNSRKFDVAGFGVGAYISDVYALIDNLAGVDYVNLTKLNLDNSSTAVNIVANAYTILQLDTANITLSSI